MADNTEDVLDNWEDEDAEVLERRMEERQKQQEKEKKTKNKSSQPKLAPVNKDKRTKEDMPTAPLEVQTHLPLRTQDAGRTEYVAPIKILKRQAETRGASPTAHMNTSSTTKRKSLAEREADYASARARILGSDSGSPSPASKPILPRGSEDSGDSIKRQPKGPNGTKGFKAKVKS